MPNNVYNRGKFLIATGTNLNTAPLYLSLVANTYVFNANNNTLADLEGQEVTTSTVNGYARQLLTSTDVIEYDDPSGTSVNGYAYLTAANVTFTTLGTGNTIGGAVLSVNTGGTAANSSSELLAFYDIVDTPTNGGDITIQWANSQNGGVLKLS